MKTTKKDECSYSVSNAIRTLAMVRPAGFEPVTFRVGGEGSEKKICCTTRLSSEFLHFDYHFDYLRRRIAPKRLRNEGAVKG